MSRRLLAIESATDWLSIAFFEDDRAVLVRRADGTRQHAAALMPMIAAGLAELGWTVAQLDALALSTGPGSFTSLRIGLATAKGLAFGRDWLGVGVSTLEAMLAEGLYGPEALAADLRAVTASPVVICPERPGWPEALGDAGVPIGRTIEGDAARPDAEHVGRLALAALARGAAEPVERLTGKPLSATRIAPSAAGRGGGEAARPTGRGGGRRAGGRGSRVNHRLAGDPAKRRVISRG